MPIKSQKHRNKHNDRTTKIRKINKSQNKARWSKNPTKYFPKVLIYPVRSIGENWFSHCQLVSITNSFLNMGGSLCSLHPLSVGIKFPWIFQVCMLPLSLWVHVFNVVVFGRCCFLGIIHHFRLLESSCFVFHIDYWALREGFDEDIPFRIKWFKVSHSLNIFHLQVSLLIPI